MSLLCALIRILLWLYRPRLGVAGTTIKYTRIIGTHFYFAPGVNLNSEAVRYVKLARAKFLDNIEEFPS